MPRRGSNPRSVAEATRVIAYEIFTNGDRWDMDDQGIGAAQAIVAALKEQNIFLWKSGHRKTHCKHGHDLDGNRAKNGGCAECRRLRSAARRKLVGSR